MISAPRFRSPGLRGASIGCLSMRSGCDRLTAELGCAGPTSPCTGVDDQRHACLGSPRTTGVHGGVGGSNGTSSATRVEATTRASRHTNYEALTRPSKEDCLTAELIAKRTLSVILWPSKALFTVRKWHDINSLTLKVLLTKDNRARSRVRAAGTVLLRFTALSCSLFCLTTTRAI